MSSNKLKPWDFVRNSPEVINTSRPGVWAIQVFDSFMERLLIKKIPRTDLPGALSFHLAQELPSDFIEAQLQTNDFFSSNESYILAQAEYTPSTLEKRFLEVANEVSDRFIIFFFTKETSFLKNLTKMERVEVLKMEPPTSWDGKRFMNFLAEQMRIKLPGNVIDYLSESIPLGSAEYISALNLIKSQLIFVGSSVTLETVRSLIGANKVDMFELTREFSQKKFQEFYQKLIVLDSDFDSFISLFAFMESHLLKLKDPSAILKKGYKNQWERSIEVSSKLWSEEEIRQALRQISELQLLAKSKSPWLKSTLQRKYYQSFI